MNNMKDCCNTGNGKQQNKNPLKKWFNYIVYAIIAIIVLGALVLQLMGD
ncbi:hypothetical protein RQM65_01070 [Pricia sp. S334]|uniref:Uncharacterized protein n=1 Tax=Pricia mediterranea TaxID=3076079 RepID=A0ABU3L0X1_9FLAO|nr:hypothetical protein [Pricia sp. S334]MDT7827253.1 hypothetical protein [Pricia sp. S334]